MNYSQPIQRPIGGNNKQRHNNNAPRVQNMNRGNPNRNVVGTQSRYQQNQQHGGYRGTTAQYGGAPMQQAVIVQQQQTMQVRCPPGAYPGTQIQIADSRGRLMMVVVPNGIGPGQMFTIATPR